MCRMYRKEQHWHTETSRVKAQGLEICSMHEHQPCLGRPATERQAITHQLLQLNQLLSCISHTFEYTSIGLLSAAFQYVLQQRSILVLADFCMLGQCSHGISKFLAAAAAPVRSVTHQLQAGYTWL